MPRKGPVPKGILADDLQQRDRDEVAEQHMVDGKKGVAQKIVYGAFDIVNEKRGKEPLEAFEQASTISCPYGKSSEKCRRCHLSGSVSQCRRRRRGLRGLYLTPKRETNAHERRLAGEIMDAVNNSGAAVKKKKTPINGEAKQSILHYKR